MADEFAVKGATVMLSSSAGAVIVVMTHTLSSAPSEPFVAADGGELLLESDIDAAFAGYTSPYTMASYVGGTLSYQSLKSVSDLSELTKKDGEAVALKKTTGTITCSAAGGTDPSSGSPDPQTSYDLDFSFIDAGQMLAKSD